MKRELVAVVLSVFAACGKGDGAKSGSGGSAAPPGSAATAPRKPSVKGSVTLTGTLLSGTFEWKDDLALQCGWVPEVNSGSFDVTMTNDTGVFIAVRVTVQNGATSVVLTSGAFKGNASPFEQHAGGANITGGDLTHVTAQIDARVTRGDDAIAIKGKLDLTCP